MCYVIGDIHGMYGKINNPRVKPRGFRWKGVYKMKSFAGTTEEKRKAVLS